MTDTLPTVSASKINLYRECGRKYYYRYIEGKDTGTNIYAAFGTALHKAIQEYHLHGADAYTVFSEALRTIVEQENVSQANLMTQFLVDGKDILKFAQWKMFNPREVELEFKLPFPNKENPIVMMHGFIDMVTDEGYIIDHKSNKKKPAFTTLSVNPQFTIYNWAYRQIYGTPPTKMYWDHLRTGELAEVIQKEYDILIKQLTEDITSLITTTHFERKPYDSVCYLCPFKELCYGIKV